MKYPILCCVSIAYMIFDYSHIHCKKVKKSTTPRTTPENGYDSHPSASLSEVSRYKIRLLVTSTIIKRVFNCFSKEWADNMFLNVSPHDSKHLIVDVLKKYLDNDTLFLELASGNGEHITHFAQNFPCVTFQPSEYECDPINDIRVHEVHYNLSNILQPTYVDVRSPSRVWFNGDIKEESVDYMFVANLLHAAPLKLATG